MRTAVGVDLGGTKIAAGIVDENGKILKRTIVPTANEQQAILDGMARVATELGATETAGIGVGAAGMVNVETGYYLYAPNVAMADVNIKEVLSKATGAPVIVDNDANVACWAEHRFGCGRGTRHFLMVTLGTGIGGGMVIHGLPYRGANGGGAEIGHMVLDPNGPMCPCGVRGCWESLASGTALTRMAREDFDRNSAIARMSGGSAALVKGPMVTDAAREGDAFALSLCARLGRYVGWGLASLVNILEPDMIAIGGGLSEDWDLFEDAAHAGLMERAEAARERVMPTVTKAALGQDAGIVGAASLVLFPEA